MTGEQFPRPPWPWADPFWWAERQFEAAALMLRLTEAMVAASVSAALGQDGRTAERLPAPVPVTAGPAATATVTVPAPAPAPVPVPDDAAERARAGVTLVPGEAAERAEPAAPGESRVPDEAAGRAEPAPAGEPQVAGAAAEEAQPRHPGVPGEAADRARAGEPPVPGWAELTLGSIRARLRRLSEEDLVALQGYEESHSARPEVVSMLQNRLTKVRSEN